MINCGEPCSVQTKQPNYCEQVAWACRNLAHTLQYATVRHCR